MSVSSSRILAFLAWLTIVAAATCVPGRAQATPAPSPAPDRWRVYLTPYIWGPTVNGSLHFEHTDIRSKLPSSAPPPAGVLPSSVNITLGPNSYLSKLNSAAMFTGEVRRGNGGFFTDLIYVNASSGISSVTQVTGPLGNVVVPINVALSTRLTTTLWTAALTGTPLPQTGPSSLDLFLGFRYFNITAKADWTLTGPLGFISPTGTAQAASTEFIPIVGMRGRAAIGPHFFFPYYLDVGGNGRINTWQGVFGFGYAYHSGAATLAWRQLSHFADSSNPTALIQSLHLGGPEIGWTFNL